jgi:hypothetical protein
VTGTDIFLSYAREDRTIARLFADGLVSDGFSVWWDASLHSGETFDEVIEQRLRDAKAVVVLWSPRSVASRWVRAEATLADRRNKLVPAIIEDCNRPIIFELTHAAELGDWTGDTSDARWRTFVLDLRRLVDADKPVEHAEAKGPASPKPAPIARPEDAVVPAEAAHRAAPSDRNGGVTDVRSPGEVHFLEMEPGQLIGDPVAIDSSSMKIGRSAPAEIVLPHKSVSREHCVVGLANDELFVTDLNSTNGTYIDGVRISRVTILPLGSVLQVGQVSLKHAVRSNPAQQRGQFQLGGEGQQAGRLAAAS